MKKILKFKRRFRVVALITGMLISAMMLFSNCFSQKSKIKNADTLTAREQARNLRQPKSCGSYTIDAAALSKALYSESINANDQLTTSYSIRVYFHICRDNDGSNAGATESQIQNEFNDLVTAFAGDGICFINMGLNYIDNSTLNNFNTASESLLATYLVPNCINIFYHDVLTNASGSAIGGSAYNIPNTYCSIANGNIGIGNTIAHEIGHCFGLLHTFEPAYGYENINGSNSSTSADKITDTPADPYAYNSMTCFSYSGLTCLYTGTCADPNGAKNFSPPYVNNMAYWPVVLWPCYLSIVFTSGQYTRINSYLSTNSGLINCESSSSLSVGPVNYSSGYHMLSAINTLTTSESVNLTGSTITTLGGNLVSLQPGFVAQPSSGGLILIVTSTCGSSGSFAAKNASVVHPEINSKANQKSLNGSAARNPLEPQSSIISKENQSSLMCYPNPFSSIINLSYTSGSTGELKIDVMDIQGKMEISIVEQGAVKGVAKKIALNLADLPAGVYILKVSDGTNSSVQKIIKM